MLPKLRKKRRHLTQVLPRLRTKPSLPTTRLRPMPLLLPKMLLASQRLPTKLGPAELAALLASPHLAGVVVSDGASKTIVVRINVTRRHPFYEKVVRTSTTLHAHDEREDAHVGDTVVVRESRPLSRTKRWRLVEVLERAK